MEIALETHGARLNGTFLQSRFLKIVDGNYTHFS